MQDIPYPFLEGSTIPRSLATLRHNLCCLIFISYTFLDIHTACALTTCRWYGLSLELLASRLALTASTMRSVRLTCIIYWCLTTATVAYKPSHHSLPSWSPKYDTHASSQSASITYDIENTSRPHTTTCQIFRPVEP